MLLFFSWIWGLFHHDDSHDSYDPAPDYTPPPIPHWAAEYRYTPWGDLPKPVRQAAREDLSYTEWTWNLPGTNDVEYLAYSELDIDQQAGSETIGLDEEGWDCWVNHYEDYFWSELEDDGVAECYEALGWSQENWLDEFPLPESEYKDWVDLTKKEKMAALCLCFFEDLWNEYLTLEAYDVSEFHY